MANDLGKKLWKKIETPQGYAYLSDSMEDMPDHEVIELAKGALAWHQESARVLRAFLKAHLTMREADGAVCTCEKPKFRRRGARFICLNCKLPPRSLR